MQKPAFTPGPWSIGIIKATPLNPRSLAVWPDSIQVGDISNPVCIVSPMESIIEKDAANARLISAAPELLAALIGLMPENQDPVFEAEGQVSLHALEQARIAIAKATKTGDLLNYCPHDPHHPRHRPPSRLPSPRHREVRSYGTAQSHCSGAA